MSIFNATRVGDRMVPKNDAWLYSPAFARAVSQALAGEGIVLSPERWAVLVEKIRSARND